MKPFTTSQKQFIEDGRKRNDKLANMILVALGLKRMEVDPKRHYYIASNPGTGKSFTVRETAKANKIDLITISGSISMNVLAITLAYAVYKKPNDKIIAWIDDCDSIFSDAESLSVMKGALDEDNNLFTWNKNLAWQIQKYEKSTDHIDLARADAIRKFQTIGGGIAVPTDRVTFVITSNKFLTAPGEKLNSPRKMNEAAIRDRVNYIDYRLTQDESWGWIAYTLTTSDLGNLKAAQKQILLDWMYNNWNRLASTSLRSIKDLAADMTNYPGDYPDHWEDRLMR